MDSDFEYAASVAGDETGDIVGRESGDVLSSVPSSVTLDMLEMALALYGDTSSDAVVDGQNSDFGVI